MELYIPDSFAGAVMSIAASGCAVAAKANGAQHFLEEKTMSEAERASASVYQALVQFLSGRGQRESRTRSCGMQPDPVTHTSRSATGSSYTMKVVQNGIEVRCFRVRRVLRCGREGSAAVPAKYANVGRSPGVSGWRAHRHSRVGVGADPDHRILFRYPFSCS